MVLQPHQKHIRLCFPVWPNLLSQFEDFSTEMLSIFCVRKHCLHLYIRDFASRDCETKIDWKYRVTAYTNVAAPFTLPLGPELRVAPDCLELGEKSSQHF